jgi:hypothetical protein
MMPKPYQYCTKKSEMAMTNIVGAGRSAPKLEKTFLNSGTTNSIITETSAATTTTEIG